MAATDSTWASLWASFRRLEAVTEREAAQSFLRDRERLARARLVFKEELA